MSKFLAFVLMFLALAGCGTTSPVQNMVAADFDVETLLIVIKDPRSERRRRGIATPAYSNTASYTQDPMLLRAGQEVADVHDLNLLAQWPIRNLAVHCLVVEKPSRETLEAVKQDPKVEWVQPFNEFSTLSGSSSAGTSADGWADLPTHTGQGVTIAVIDTSIDHNHPAFEGSVVRQQNFAGSSGEYGVEPHGTAVVGLIAAQPGHVKGVRGVAPDAQVEVLRACWQNNARGKGVCNTLTLALALDAAVDLAPEILNLSLTGPEDVVLQALIDRLLENGTLVVAAFDDGLKPNMRFPLNRQGIVYAYGVDGDQQSPAVTTPDTVLLQAPRHAVSLSPAGGSDLVSGHSIAAPQLSGLAARLMAQEPESERQHILAMLSQWLKPQ
ncbi:MAG: S8 family serine peptidase [Pseudomonadota bacterium]